MKKLTRAYRRPWFLWIGGACFLVGSLVAGSIGLASSAPPPGISGTVTANQGTGTGNGGSWKVDGSGVTQPVSGTVGLSAGTSDIGTVHVAAPTRITGQTSCDVSTAMTGCATADLGLATGNVLNTLNVQCAIPHVGQHVSVTFDDANVTVTIPLTYTVTDSAGFADHYAGTATDLGVLIPSPPTSSVTVFESYVATSSTDGASCEITFAGTLS